ncbi:MAG: histidinol-phosphate transaminase [Bdellovibrionales bacterium]
MNWLENLIRPDLRALAGYSSARTEAAFDALIALDANECPWPPFGSLSSMCEPHRYPDPQPSLLRQRLAAVYGVMPQQLLLGRGSDEGIDLLIRLLCRAGEDEILVCPPTFGMYKVYADIQGVRTLAVPLTGKWQLDVPAVIKACTSRTKLIFIPSPNAPMGHLMRQEDILALCRSRTEQSLIVIDEAYIEFTGRSEGLVGELKNYPNLVILRTMSKSHALAGERVGAVIAQPELLLLLQKVQAPYPLVQSSILAALDALSPNGLVQSAERRRLLIAERDRLKRLLPQSALVESLFPSDANFLLVQTRDAKAFMRELQRFGIRARDRSKDIPNAVRFSPGTPEENNALLAALGIDASAKSSATRLFSKRRKTRETAIDVTVNLDDPNVLDIQSGIGFFDHMLAQLASHGGFGLVLRCKGDLEIDQHHSIEDCALALGEALKGALGDKRGVARFGFTAPLDEALAQVTVDLSGRPYFVFSGHLPSQVVGEMSSEMVPHFFRSLATAMAASIHVTVTGENTHHMVEASFKATGRALRDAFRREGKEIPSTKGIL